MKKTIIKITAFVVTVHGIAVASADFDSGYLLGGSLGLHGRTSNYTFESNRIEKSVIPTLQTLGFQFGKKFNVHPKLLLRLVGDLSTGVINEDTLSNVMLDNGKQYDLLLSTRYFMFSSIFSVQKTFARKEKTSLFALLGVGVHLTDMSQSETTLGEQLFRIDNPYLESHLKTSLSGHVGAGTELYFSKTIGLEIGYTLRAWTPIAHNTQGDLFPFRAIPYKEQFLSQIFSLNLVVVR